MMNRLLLSVATASVITIVGPAATGQAQIEFEPTVSSSEITLDDQGNLLLEGHCFSFVSSLPSGVRLTTGHGAVGILNGNLYSRVGIAEHAGPPFPESTVEFKEGSNVLGSVSPYGYVYLKGECQNVDGCSNTKWEPWIWNDGGTVQLSNNCYNYTNDKVTNTFAQPGRASGHPINSSDDLTVAEVRDAALSDGLTWVGWNFPGNTYDCGNGHLIFMAVWPDVDYHWWRLDHARGLWSHKPGKTQARTTDNSGATITNPLTADRGGYTAAGGFYCTCGGLANVN